MNTFMCSHRNKSWEASISVFRRYDTYYEFMIQHNLSILVVFGRTSKGYVACLPDFNASCYLFTLNDLSFNSERLINLLGVANGVTIASALLFLAEKLCYLEF